MKEFSLNNATGDIIHVDEVRREICYFRDPWGRDSSSIPDTVVRFDELHSSDLFKQLEAEMYPNDWVELKRMLTAV